MLNCSVGRPTGMHIDPRPGFEERAEDLHRDTPPLHRACKIEFYSGMWNLSCSMYRVSDINTPLASLEILKVTKALVAGRSASSPEISK